MTNREVTNAVRRAVKRAVNRAVYLAVYDAVCRAVTRAVYRAVGGSPFRLRVKFHAARRGEATPRDQPEVTDAVLLAVNDVELSHDESSTITLEGDEFHMEAIYTDQEQCERFDAPYFDSGELVIAADTLLRSKGGDGYDTPHVEFLSQFGGQTLMLSRKDGDRIGPGWWRVVVLRGPGQ